MDFTNLGSYSLNRLRSVRDERAHLLDLDANDTTQHTGTADQEKARTAHLVFSLAQLNAEIARRISQG